MADKSLTFNVYGKDVSGTKTIRGIGNEAQSMGKAFGKTTSLIGAGLGALGIAAAGTKVVDFLHDSVDAYRDAEVQQSKLEDAYKRFPAVTNVAIDKLREYNHQLSYKVGYDDDAIASSQAVIAAFGLTGDQIQGITPLIVDYAAKTGTDLPSAASALGKALLGNQKALKSLGVEGFKPTGDRAKDVDTLVGLLQAKIGGFAEQVAGTDAGKLQILQTKFGDLQETVGSKLVPAFSGLVDYVTDHVLPTLDELGQAKGIEDFFAVIEKHSKGGDTFGFLDSSAWEHGAQQWKDFLNGGAGEYDPAKTNGPLDPVPWQNGWDQIIAKFANGGAQIKAMLNDGQTNPAGTGGPLDPAAWQNGWDQITANWNSSNANLRALLNNGQTKPTGTGGPLDLSAWANGWDQITAHWRSSNANLSKILNNGTVKPTSAGGPLDLSAWAHGWQQIQDFFSGHPATARVHWINDVDPAPNFGATRQAKPFATGGIVKARPGGLVGRIGEAGVDEAVLPLTDDNLAALGGGGGGSGTTVNVTVNVNGAVLDSPAKLGRAVYDAVLEAKRQGSVPRTAFGNDM